MGKRKLILGIVVGAVVGGLTAQFDRETRNYTKGRLSAVRSSSSNFIKNPSQAIHNVREVFDQFNKNFASGAENAINALEQVEETLDKVTNRKDGKEIE